MARSRSLERVLFLPTSSGAFVFFDSLRRGREVATPPQAASDDSKSDEPAKALEPCRVLESKGSVATGGRTRHLERSERKTKTVSGRSEWEN